MEMAITSVWMAKICLAIIYIKWVCSVCRGGTGYLYYEHNPHLLKTVSWDCDSSFLECNNECHEGAFYLIKQPELGFAANLQPPKS